MGDGFLLSRGCLQTKQVKEELAQTLTFLLSRGCLQTAWARVADAYSHLFLLSRGCLQTPPLFDIQYR